MKIITIPVTSYQQNCSLLVCEETNKAAFVDPGGEIPRLQAALEKEKATLESIFLTHGHLDHIGGTAELAALYNVPIIGPHKDDNFLIEAIPAQQIRFQFSGCGAFTPTRWLKQGDMITVGHEELEVLHCPGHTPGHVVLYHANSKLAFVGDVIFKGSIGRTDLEKGDFQTLFNSIKNKLWPLGGDVRFISGHGEISTFAEEMESNPFVGKAARTRI
ncbi:MAG: MBL fold metallo-hydrolase [Methylococcales bacterium]|nr:MBL fold metallo-hydrolase [Methylococcales bacterium]